MGVGVLTGWVHLSRSWVWLKRDNHRLATRDGRSVGRGPWLAPSGTDDFSGFNITFILHAYSQGRDHWELWSGKDEPSWPGAHDQLAVHPSLALRILYCTVCLWPLLDSIPFNHWNRFYHKDSPSSLQARRVGDSPNLGPSPAPHPSLLSHLLPIAHATIGYRRTRTLLVPFDCFFPWRRRRHPHLRRQSTRVAACS